MQLRRLCAIGAATIMLTIGVAMADPLPAQLGQCSSTTIKDVTTRLRDGVTKEPMPDSGSAIDFTNGGYQVSYDTIAAVTQSRAGDPVTMCLISIPRNCPAGDERGRTYKTTNLRTHGVWTLPDAEHRCGGA